MSDQEISAASVLRQTPWNKGNSLGGEASAAAQTCLVNPDQT